MIQLHCTQNTTENESLSQQSFKPPTNKPYKGIFEMTTLDNPLKSS